MPPAGSNTAVDNTVTSNRRQPIRQTRTQPPKYAFSRGSMGGRPSIGAAGEDRVQAAMDPGFYPALAHFTDSITALPKEMLRHFGMFKEVDSKIYSPEESLKRLVKEALVAPQPLSFLEASKAFENQSQAQSDAPSATVSINGANGASIAPGPSQISFLSQVTGLDKYDVPRRQMYLNLRYLINEMLPVLEEKNHVISSATDELSKQLARCESSWPDLEKEFSDETRWGNLNHWAYADRSAEKKDTRIERPRREAAVHHNFAAVHDDFGAVRGTGKRRAQQAQIENEIEETRANKRGLGTSKTKKQAANQATAVGLGLSIGSGTAQTKKRKPEDLQANVPVMERSLSSVFGKNAGSKGNSSPRSRSPAGVKRARGTGMTGVNGKSRARAGTGASAANSPLIASSPVVGTLAATKPIVSPATGVSMQRQPSARARQNSTQSATIPVAHPKQPSSSSSNNNNNNNNIETGPTSISVKSNGRIPKTEFPQDDIDAKPTPVKREDSTASRHRPPNITTGTRASGKASKNATPVHSSFAEATVGSRPRSNRANYSADSSNGRNGSGEAPAASSPALAATAKRGHKKTSSLAAAHRREESTARANVAVNHAPGGNDGADEAADDEDEGNGERYCYCGGPSYGDMVGCDGDGCPKEWFHLDCIGLSKIPAGKAKWYCEECKKRLKLS